MTILTVAVHGAGGTQGTHIVRRLAAAGLTARPVRSAATNLTDVDALVRAYAGADAVVLQLPLVFGPAVRTYAETALAALAKAGVARAVFSPGMALPPDPVGVPFVDARVLLARHLSGAVGVASMIGPAGTYLENLTQPWSVRLIRDSGELAYPLPAAVPVPWLALDDLGDAIAAALTADHPPAVAALAGPQALTGDELAAVVGAAAGRPVRYRQVSPAEYESLLATVLDAEAAAGVAAAYAQEPGPPPPAAVVRFAPTTAERWAARQDWTG
jgi:uncharacterized protein YbjT (DUF2867 family)